MIVFIGDIHGEFVYLPQMLKHVPDDAFVTVRVLGINEVWEFPADG